MRRAGRVLLRAGVGSLVGLAAGLLLGLGGALLCGVVCWANVASRGLDTFCGHHPFVYGCLFGYGPVAVMAFPPLAALAGFVSGVMDGWEEEIGD